MPAWITSLLRDDVSVPMPSAASSTMTSRPARASARATAKPTTPAPTTTQSTHSKRHLPAGIGPIYAVDPTGARLARCRLRSGESLPVPVRRANATPLLRWPDANAVLSGNVHALACLTPVPFSNRIAQGRFLWDAHLMDRNFDDNPHTTRVKPVSHLNDAINRDNVW